MLASWILISVLSVTNAFLLQTAENQNYAFQKPGCHKVGHTRKISIPGCIEFDMTTNACRGFCESWAVPSTPGVSQPVTSIGQCCNIMDTEPVHATVACVDGLRNLTFKSALSCLCYHCKKD